MARSKPKRLMKEFFPKEKPNIFDVLKKFASDNTVSILSSTFDCIEVAEKELRDESDEVANEAYMLLMPKNEFHGLSLTIFRHHCLELIERVKTGHSTQPGTKAEVMIALSSTSLGVPLASSYAKLYTELFNEIMQPAEPMEVGQYDWPDEGFELLDMLRVKTKQDWRK